MSGFMNNVGALGLLMPVALQSALQAKRPAGVVLMPLSFACILGGLVTLIGTPPNIIVASFRGDVTGSPFGMFSYTPVGAGVMAAGILFVALVGWRLVPQRRQKGAAEEDLFAIEDYVAEARVKRGGKTVGKTLPEIEALTEEIEARVVGLLRRGHVLANPSRRDPLRVGDRLLIEANSEQLTQFVETLELALVPVDSARKELTGDAEAELVEAVVAPRAQIEGRTIGSLRLRRRFGVNLLAVSRQGRPHRSKLSDFRVRAGDVLLLYGEADAISEALAAFGCLPLRARSLRMARSIHPLLPVGIFAAGIALASFGLLPVTIALGLVLGLYVVTGILPLRELYDAVDWPVIVLLGALIPVGGALQTTGATDVIVGAIQWLTAGLPAVVVLGLLLVVTMTVSDVLNNAATAVVMAPIGYSLAERLDASPDPFLMAVAVGASCAFLTPIGHQNNALVLGPGGYRFSDYWRMGLPLEALIVVVAVPLILLVWPL
jgi:di/tricarboxylate transporter